MFKKGLILLFAGQLSIILCLSPVQAAKSTTPIVKEAISLKTDSKMEETYITEHLVYKYEGSTTPFGGTKLDENEIKVLKESGFSREFIGRLEGIPTYVSLGAAGIWLKEANEVVGAGLIRIVWPPRSYFHDLNSTPFSGIPETKDWYYNFDISQARAWIHRFDLNVGLSSDGENINGNEGSSPFYLVGVSYEIHKAVFLNTGLAFSTEGDFDENDQFYFGLTLDSNLLKMLNIAQ